MDREEILDEINKTKEHLANMEKMLKECKYKRWKPNSCDAYYYIDAFGNVLSQIETGHSSDGAFWKSYNCFKTREQAEAEAEKILVRRMLEDIARRLNKGKEIDWNSESPRKYHLCIDKADYIYTNVCYSTKYQGTIYCLDANFRDVAIQEIGEKRLIKYLRGEINEES